MYMDDWSHSQLAAIMYTSYVKENPVKTIQLASLWYLPAHNRKLTRHPGFCLLLLY